jgi:bacterioferritin
MSAQPKAPQGKPTLTDVQTLRSEARRHIEEGAVTQGYAADREKVLQMLNEALATELVCVLRYRHDYFVARGLKAKVAAAEFLEHANQEMEHADLLAERIVQLGGEPNFNPSGLVDRSHSEYRLGSTLQEMIRENLVAERIAIDSYRQMIQYVGNDDPTTRRLFEGVLATEEEHADDLADLLDDSAGSKVN